MEKPEEHDTPFTNNKQCCRFSFLLVDNTVLVVQFPPRVQELLLKLTRTHEH